MEDETGTPMCDGCADDAMESGLFRSEALEGECGDCGEPLEVCCDGIVRCLNCRPCPACDDGGMDAQLDDAACCYGDGMS